MRTILAVVLNFFALPLGYYFLKAPRRMALFMGYYLLAPALVIGALLTPETLWGLPQLALLTAIACGLNGIIIYDTIGTARKGPLSDHRLLSLPHSLWVIPVVLVGIVVIGNGREWITHQLVRTHSIATDSMKPTVNVGDFVFSQSLGKQDQIRRGDLVTYDAGNGALWVKRVIALPGEHVEIRQSALGNKITVGRIAINGKEIRIRQVGQAGPGKLPTARFEELLPGASRPHIVLESPESFVPGKGRWSLGPDEFFVLGDNRDQSKDSRMTGPIQRSQIKGRLMYIYASFSHGIEACQRAAITQREISNRCEAILGRRGRLQQLWERWRQPGPRWQRFGLRPL